MRSRRDNLACRRRSGRALQRCQLVRQRERGRTKGESGKGIDAASSSMFASTGTSSYCPASPSTSSSSLLSLLSKSSCSAESNASGTLMRESSAEEMRREVAELLEATRGVEAPEERRGVEGCEGREGVPTVESEATFWGDL